LPVEVKCPYPSNGESGLLNLFKSRKSPFYITVTFNKSHDVYNQIQKQIHATGKEKGHLLVHYNDDKGEEETVLVPVPRDQERINELLKKEEEKEAKEEKKTSITAEQKNKKCFEAASKEFEKEFQILMFHNKKVQLEALTKTGEPIVLKYLKPKKSESSLLDKIKKNEGNCCITVTFNKSNSAYSQVQKQIHATGKEQGYLVVHYNNGNGKEETVVVPVPRDDERIGELLKKAEQGEEEVEGEEAEEGEEGEEKKDGEIGGSGGGRGRGRGWRRERRERRGRRRRERRERRGRERGGGRRGGGRGREGERGRRK